MDDEMCKAERLAVAAAVAPSLRAAPEEVRTRRVAIVDKDGNVVGYRALVDVQKEILKARAIELEVQPDTRPKTVVCVGCGKVVRTKPIGRLPERCQACVRGKCTKCGKVLAVGRTRPSSKCRGCAGIAKRKPSVCAVCGKAIARVRKSKQSSVRRCLECVRRAKKPDNRCMDCGARIARVSTRCLPHAASHREATRKESSGKDKRET